LIRFEKSKGMFESAKQFITGGVHSGFRYIEPHPIYFSKAKGSRVWDVDGNEYIDCLINMGSVILGHGHPKVVNAVKAQLEKGLTVGLETELSIEVAKELSRMIPSAEVVKFSNTGTEAVMHAIQIARGYTGKNKIIKLEGGYNGWYDYVLVSTHPKLEDAGPRETPNTVLGSAGLAREVVQNTIIMPFNDVEAAERIIVRHRDEVAALVMEPVMFNVGCTCPKKGYLETIRELTEDNGIVLIYDEVITGFRMAPGGAQQYYNVIPDISVFGKAIANGFPLSAVVGKRDFMGVAAPKTGKVVYAGTFNANQMALAASKAVLEELHDGKVQKYLHEGGRQLVKNFEDAAEDLGLEARLQEIAGKFQVYFTDREVVDYRTAVGCDEQKYLIFQEKMLNSGILMWPSYTLHHGITAAHSKEDLETISKTMETALEEVKERKP